MVVRIHPGQSSTPRLLLARLLLPLALAVLAVPGLAGQEERADSAALRSAARDAQAAFERIRRRASPRASGGWGSRCDEIVGRICLRLEPSGDWWPRPDPPRVTEQRDLLIARLAAAGAALPGDPWILGQRVVYVAEAGRTSQALALARTCGPRDAVWCGLLEGYLLHLQHRFPEAERAFRRALAAMEPGERRSWLDPRPLLDRHGRSLLDAAAAPRRDTLVERFWDLADPLFLVEGNDRWTEHMARGVVARTREEAENPYDLNWGDDLAEVLVRYGWELGWEQITPTPSAVAGTGGAVGHQHPESRSLVPPGRALSALAETRWESWNPGSRFLPRTGYAPSYAPVVLPADAEVYRVPRGDSLVLVVALEMPPDTTYHRDHDHDPLPSPGPFRDGSPRAGLFLVDESGGLVSADTAAGSSAVLRLTVPPGRYLLSAELWDPDSLRAGRHREGIRWAALPPDLPTASDLFVLESAGEAPASLEEVLRRLLRRSPGPGEAFRVAWELYGFGWEPHEVLSYQLEVQEAPGGFLRRAGRFLGLVGGGEVLSLAWEEPGPGAPGPFLRSTELTLPPGLGDGDYRLRLRVEAAGREALVLERTFRVTSPSR